MVGCEDVPKESGVTKNVDCGLVFQENVRRGGGAVVLMEGFGDLTIGDTPVSLSWCGKGFFQLNLVGPVGYHHKTFKEVIRISVYHEGRHESIHVVVGHFLGVDVCMRLANLGPVRALFGAVAELLVFEALELAKVPRLPLNIIGVCFAVVRVIIIILHEDDVARGCM